MVVYKMRRSRSVKRPKRVSRRRRNAGRTVSRRRNRQSKRLSLRNRNSKRVSKRINRKSSRNRRKSRRNTRKRNTRKRNTRRRNTHRRQIKRRFIGGANYNIRIADYQDKIAAFDKQLQMLKKGIDMNTKFIDANPQAKVQVDGALKKTDDLLTKMEKLAIQKALLEKRVELLTTRKNRESETNQQSTRIDERLTAILSGKKDKAQLDELHELSNKRIEERRQAKIDAKAAAEAEAAKAEASEKARGSWAHVRKTVIHDVHLKKDQLDAIRNFGDAGKKQEIKDDLKRRRDEKKRKLGIQLKKVNDDTTKMVNKIEEQIEDKEEAYEIALQHETEATDYLLGNIENHEVAETKLQARREELRDSIAKRGYKKAIQGVGVVAKVTEILKKQEEEAKKLAEEAVLQQQEEFEADDIQADCGISTMEKMILKLRVLQPHVDPTMRKVPISIKGLAAASAAAATFRPGEASAAIPMRATNVPRGVRLPPLQPLSTDDGGVNEELLEAAENGDIGTLNVALVNGDDPNATDEEGKTALQHAAAANSVECVEALLAKGAGIDKTDLDGTTPLMQAAKSGNTEVVELLLQEGADKSLTDSDGGNALDYAKNGEFGEDPGIAKMLSGNQTEEEGGEKLKQTVESASLLSTFMTQREAKKAEVDRKAAEQERVAAEAEAEAKRVQMEKEEAEAEAKRVQMEDAEAEAKRVREERLEELRRAADQASLIASVLKKKGAAAKDAVAFQKAEKERIAAEEALIAEQLEQERVAAEAEAARIAEEESRMDWNVELINQAQKGDAKGALYALDKGGDPNSISSGGITALQHAAAVNSEGCLEALLNAGTDIDIIGTDKITALMQAAFSESIEALKFLLEKGADWRLTDSEGKTALDYAYDGEVDPAIVILGKWIRENGTKEEKGKLEREVAERRIARIVEQRDQRVANDPVIQANRAAKALADAGKQRLADEDAAFESWLKEYEASRKAAAEAKQHKIDEEWALRKKKKAEEKAEAEAAREARIQAEELELEEKELRIQNGLAPSGRWYCSPAEKEVKENLTDLRGIVTLFVEKDESVEGQVGDENVVGVVDGEYDKRDNARTRSPASAAFPTITGVFNRDNTLKLDHSSDHKRYQWDIQFTEVDESTAVDFRSHPVDILTGTWSRPGASEAVETKFVAYRLKDINEICGKMLEKVQTIAGVKELLIELGILPNASLKPCYYLTRYNFHHLNRGADEPYDKHQDRDKHADCLWSMEDASIHTEPYFKYCNEHRSTSRSGGDVMIDTSMEVDDQEGVVAQEFLYEPRLHGPNCKQKYMWDTLIEFINKGDMEKYILTKFGVDLSFIGFQAALTQFKIDMEDVAEDAFLGPDQFKIYKPR